MIYGVWYVLQLKSQTGKLVLCVSTMQEKPSEYQIYPLLPCKTIYSKEYATNPGKRLLVPENSSSSSSGEDHQSKRARLLSLLSFTTERLKKEILFHLDKADELDLELKEWEKCKEDTETNEEEAAEKSDEEERCSKEEEVEQEEIEKEVIEDEDEKKCNTETMESEEMDESSLEKKLDAKVDFYNSVKDANNKRVDQKNEENQEETPDTTTTTPLLLVEDPKKDESSLDAEVLIIGKGENCDEECKHIEEESSLDTEVIIGKGGDSCDQKNAENQDETPDTTTTDTLEDPKMKGSEEEIDKNEEEEAICKQEEEMDTEVIGNENCDEECKHFEDESSLDAQGKEENFDQKNAEKQEETPDTTTTVVEDPEMKEEGSEEIEKNEEEVNEAICKQEEEEMDAEVVVVTGKVEWATVFVVALRSAKSYSCEFE